MIARIDDSRPFDSWRDFSFCRVSGASDPNAAFLSPSAKKSRFRKRLGVSKAKEASSGLSGSGSTFDDSLERVIGVKNCPLCHRPRLKSEAEMDIVTHLAVCPSQDWTKVDRIMVGNFVTASQAQRKWYTKIIGKVSSGEFRLGAVGVSVLRRRRGIYFSSRTLRTLLSKIGR